MNTTPEIIFPLTVAKLVKQSGIAKQSIYNFLNKHNVKPKVLSVDAATALWVQTHFNPALHIGVVKHYVELTKSDYN